MSTKSKPTSKSTTLPAVLLKPGEADRILAGHPWIYKGSILRITQSVEDGGIVQVKDHRQRLLGTGFYNSLSKIHVRMIAPERVEVDRKFFAQKIEAARALRQRYLPGATSLRVVNSESDFLSGLTVDKYEDVLVVQFSSLGMDQRRPMILAVLKEMYSPRAIVERSDMASRKFEGLEESNQILEGDFDGTLQIKINELHFTTSLLSGHKTGFYLDQQENYQAVAELARHAGVRQALDCFCFHGGFSLHLARAGVSQVHALDQSEEAISCAEQNAKANGLAGRITFEAANVFDWLKGRTVAGPHEKLVPPFDMVVLDPPSFTRNRRAVPDALRGYKEIHLRAMKLLKPGGLLVTFCCSHHVDERLFEEVILTAAYDARRLLRRVSRFTQSSDHPVLPSIPETEYLKGYAYEVGYRQ